MDERPLTSGQVAKLFNVTVETVAAWADKGKLECFYTPGGQRRFHRSVIDARLVPSQSEDGAA